MPRRAKLVNSLSKGVLDPDLSERIDLAHYYSGLLEGDNIEMLPQGGFRRRAGTMLAYPSRLRRQLQPLVIDAAMVTVHNGGTVAALVDQNPATAFTTLAVGAEPFVVVELDLVNAYEICFVDVIDFRNALKAGATGKNTSGDDCLVVEFWDGQSWQPMPGPDNIAISPRKNIRNIARSRRFGGHPGFAATARYWRLVIYDGLQLGAITVGGLLFWTESARLSQVRLLSFAKSADDRYQLVVTDRNIDVFDASGYLASISLALSSDDIPLLNSEQSQDTLFLFHEDLATPQIVRQGSGDEWQWAPAAFVNVPLLSSSISFSGAQDELQELTFTGLAAGDRVACLLDNQMTIEITYADPAQFVSDLGTAIGSLPGIIRADLYTSLRQLMPLAVRVEFRNANGGRRWPRIVPVVLGASAAVTASSVVRRGVKSSGAVMSAETGWPRCGALHQSRLLLGGFRAAPQTILGSMTGNPFSFLMGGSPLTADKAIMYTIDTDQVETIHDIFVGRHLQVFTETGEWWSEARTLDATQPMTFVLASRNGLTPACPVVFGETGTLFMQNGGRILRDFSFNNVDVNYDAQILSLLAPHLVSDVVDMAFRRARSTSEGNQLFCVNRDGSIAHLCLLKSQEVVAWTRHTTTAGSYRAVLADSAFNVYFAVERNGDLWLEQRDAERSTDATVRVTQTASVPGLAHVPPGTAVWAYADRDLQGPLNVSNGAVAIEALAAEVFAGLNFPVHAVSLPMRDKIAENQPFRVPARIFKAELTLTRTGDAQFATNGDAARNVPLHRIDGTPLPVDATGFDLPVDILDQALLDRLYTGPVLLENLSGFSRHPRWQITQTVPAPLTVKSVRLELVY
jgi:hypothetical protein